MVSVSAIARRAKRIWKWLLSFSKTTWTIRDYPVWLHRQADEPPDPDSRFKLYPWVAQIDGWNVISGMGNTRDEALAKLAEDFEKQRSERTAEGERLPRPGTDVPVQFASSVRVDAHRDLLNDFIHRVLELEWAFISDKTQLWNFSLGGSNDAYVTRVSEIYGVDISDIADAPVADILDRIAAAKRE